MKKTEARIKKKIKNLFDALEVVEKRLPIIERLVVKLILLALAIHGASDLLMRRPKLNSSSATEVFSGPPWRRWEECQHRGYLQLAGYQHADELEEAIPDKTHMPESVASTTYYERSVMERIRPCQFQSSRPALTAMTTQQGNRPTKYFSTVWNDSAIGVFLPLLQSRFALMKSSRQSLRRGVDVTDQERSDRRGADRFPIEREVRYKILSRKSLDETGVGKTINMSSNGVLFTTDRHLLPGKRLEVSISWPAQLNSRIALKLVARGRVVRSEEDRAAIEIHQYEFRTQASQGTPVAP